MKLEHGAGVKMVCDQEDDKCRGNECAKNQSKNVPADSQIAGHEQAEKKDAQRHEGVDVEERHRRIKRELEPKWERAPLAIFVRGSEKFFSPMPEQNQAGRNRVKQTALGDKHCQRNALPGDVIHVLIVVELESAQELEPRDSAIEKKAGNRKGAAPAIERVERCERREQTDPDQPGN